MSKNFTFFGMNSKFSRHVTEKLQNSLTSFRTDKISYT